MKFTIELCTDGDAFEISDNESWGAGFAGELSHAFANIRACIINGLSESAGHNFTRVILDSNGNRCGSLRATLRDESAPERGSLSDQGRATVYDLQKLLESELAERIANLGEHLGAMRTLNIENELVSSLALISNLSSALGALGISELAALAGTAIRRADPSSADVLRAVRRSARDSK